MSNVQVTAAQNDGTAAVKPVVADDRAAVRAATLTELASLPASEVSEPEPQADNVQTSADVASTQEPAASEPSTAEPGKPDAETEKRLGVIQRAQKQFAQQKAEVEAQFAEQRKAIESQLAKIEAYEQKRARAKYDPDVAAELLGLTDEDYEPIARGFYARSKAGQAQPVNREQAARLLKDREISDQLAATQKQLRDLMDQTAKEKAEAKSEAQRTQYMSALERAVGDETPLVRNMFAKNPERARKEMQNVAAALWQDTGEVPDPSDVMTAYEKLRRSELEDLGIDVEPILKQTTKKKPPVAEETKPAKTLSNDLSTSTVPRSALPDDRQSRRQQMIRELEALEAQQS